MPERIDSSPAFQRSRTGAWTLPLSEGVAACISQSGGSLSAGRYSKRGRAPFRQLAYVHPPYTCGKLTLTMLGTR
jgi:hypothetical protein